MRQLNIAELESKTQDYFLDVEYAQHNDVKNRLTQLMNFLISQDISRRILERITEEYSDLYHQLEPLNDQTPERTKRDIIDSLNTPDLQGAFGTFLLIKNLKNHEKFLHIILICHGNGTAEDIIMMNSRTVSISTS